jgi:EmrB/QacA subfamily drug resistance transporter
MADAAASSSTFCPGERRRYVLIAAILASSMGFIDGSVVAIATPAIRADLGATLGEAQWVSNAYLLLLSSVLLLGGAAGDRFGVRNVFGIGIAVFVAASMVCAVAPDPLFLIAARAVQGLGAAFMVPASLALIAKAYPRAERGKAIGLWSSFSSLTTILGPVIGGLVLTWLGEGSWRLVFAVNLPLGGIALALLFVLVPADQPESGRRLDVTGGALATVGLGLMALGLTGDSGTSLTTSLLWAGAGVVVLAVFLWWEARARSPMLPLGLFRNVGFSGAQGLTFALYFALAAVTFYLPMTLIGGWGVTPAEVSIVLLPLGLALTLLSGLAGSWSDRIGPGPMIAIGATVVAAAFALMGLTAPLHNLWFILLPLNALFGIGMSLVVSPLSTAVMTAVDDRDTGVASGVNNAVARVAGLFAVATMGAVAAMVFGAVAEGSGTFGVVPESPLAPDAESARVAASDAAFASVAYICAALSLLAAGIAWFTQEKRLGNRR